LEISLRPYRLVRLQRKHSVDQVADGQSVMPAGPSAVLPETKPTALPIALRLVTHPVAVRKFNEATGHCFLARERGAAGPCGLVGPIGRCTRKVLHFLHALWLELEGRRLSWPNDGVPERFSALKRHTVATCMQIITRESHAPEREN